VLTILVKLDTTEFLINFYVTNYNVIM